MASHGYKKLIEYNNLVQGLSLKMILIMYGLICDIILLLIVTIDRDWHS